MNKSWSGLPLVIFGIGGCAREIAMLIHDVNQNSCNPVFNFIGFISHINEDVGKHVDGYPIVSSNALFPTFARQFNLLGVCLGLANPIEKKKLNDDLIDYTNIVFPNIIHPGAFISKHSKNYFGHGVVVSSGVNITMNITLGNHVLLNRSCNVGHDSIIGDYCTVNPGAVVSGNVTIGPLTLIGASSSIREKTKIGHNSVVGLGAIITKDVESDTVVYNDAAVPRKFRNQKCD
ncbi:MAG TPA: hypothetical protein IAA29_05715 [Candidatus Paenibacillus intestinavium]|nr:hypothetical protein [Candidatus Paenibacillus intestinavium]